MGSHALRKGTWKPIPNGTGGKRNAATNFELRKNELFQSYDFSTDLGETNNIAAQHADLVKEMAVILEQIRTQSRSLPAP